MRARRERGLAEPAKSRGMTHVIGGKEIARRLGIPGTFRFPEPWNGNLPAAKPAAPKDDRAGRTERASANQPEG